MELLVRNAVLAGYVELVRSLGADPMVLLAAAGLDHPDLSAPSKWIPADAAARLLELTAEATACSDFGLRLAGTRRLSTLGPVSLVAREEPNVRGALAVIMRYQHLHNEALRSRLTESNGLATIELALEQHTPRSGWQSIDLLVGAVHRYIQSLIGESWRPVAVTFTHAEPAETTTHRRLLGPSLRFGQEMDSIVFYSADLEAPNKLADPLLRPYAQQYLASIALPRTTEELDRIRDLIEALLPTGRCSLQQVARTMGVERKTVHRHLAASGATYTSLLDDVRTRLARQYVGRHDRPLTQIAALLGFSSLSTFSRWFSARFDASPQVWRTDHGEAAARSRRR